MIARWTVFAFCAISFLFAASQSFSQDISPQMRKDLASLKELCDDDLLAPRVCEEKQRAILGLSSGTPEAPSESLGLGSSEAATTPDIFDDLTPKEYDSPRLGYHVSLPTGWRVLARDQLRAGIADVQQHLANNPAAREAFSKLGERALASNIEMFQKDNTQVQAQPYRGRLPGSFSDRSALCNVLTGGATRIPGRTLSTHECRLEDVDGQPAIYLERDSSLTRMRSLQYWVQNPKGVVVQFVSSCMNPRPELCQENFELFMSKLTWQNDES